MYSYSTVSRLGEVGGGPEHHQLKGAPMSALHFNRVEIKNGTDTLKYD